MDADDYQVATRATAMYPGCHVQLASGPKTPEDTMLAIAYLGLGLGEQGEVQAHFLQLVALAFGLGKQGDVQGQVKKAMRDDGQVITDDRRAAIVKELGDLLWYAARLADELGVPLSRVMQDNLDKLADRKARGVLAGSGDNR